MNTYSIRIRLRLRIRIHIRFRIGLVWYSSRSNRGLLAEGPGHGEAESAKHLKFSWLPSCLTPESGTYLSTVPTPGLSRDPSPSIPLMVVFVGLAKDCARSLSSRGTSHLLHVTLFLP